MAAAPIASAAEFPRTYVQRDADFGLWETAEPSYRELAERPVATLAEWERWLIDWSEVDACFDEEGTRRYTSMTCQVDDAARETAYLAFLEDVRPKREPWHHKLRQKLVALADRLKPPAKRYEVLIRSARAAVELFRDENIPLQTEDAKLQQRYQKICAAMTVAYDGREQTLQQLARYLEEPDRAVREKTWRLAAQRFHDDAPQLDEIYVEMVALRDRMARNAACADYRDYAFKGYQRFDYTPQDCLAFHDSIEKVVVPAVAQLLAERRKKLGLSTLRPWDVAVDPDSRPPLRPFKTDDELIDGCAQIFHRVSGDLGKVFETLRQRSMLDLGSRKGKAPGGYQAMFAERRMPFIFMNAVGTEGDVRTLLHEGGHAFHAWASRHEPLIAYRHAPIEFCEVASMGMECLALPFTDIFYGDESRRARKRFFEEIVAFFPWMARVDAFQHHVYTHVGDGIDKWKDQWQALTKRFAPSVDWSGLESFDRHSWHRKLHFFEVPFYYVEYGIAQLGALQVWRNSCGDYAQAVNWYRNGLALGGARPLPELFEAAGLKFDFSEKTIRPLIDAAMEEIGRL